MSKTFYQSTDVALANGSANLVAVVTPVVASFGIPAIVLTNYTALTENFGELLAISSTPATRTSMAIESKNEAKELLRSASVQIARMITAMPSVTNAQLMSLLLNPRTTRGSRNLPENPPLVDVISVQNRVANILVHEAGSERRGMPYGARSANVYTFVGPAAADDAREYHFEGGTNRAKTQIVFPDSVPNGATIWVNACWVGGRGQIGFAGTPIPFTLQGGAIGGAVG